MAVDLSTYTDIETALFVKIEIAQWRNSATNALSAYTLYLSDYYRDQTVNGDLYNALGKLVNIGVSTSEVKSAGDTMTISLFGIPDTEIRQIIHSEMKGAQVSVYRVLFDATTHEQLAITGNPVGRFFGYVSNYSVTEDYELSGLTQEQLHTVNLECASWITLLGNTRAGRRTNPYDMKKFYPSDTSFDRVPNLVGSSYDFGKKK